MTHQWEAEQIIEPPMALQLIKEQFPELSSKSIRLLGAGGIIQLLSSMKN